MFKRLLSWGGLTALLVLPPRLALAAGEKATDLVVVADTRTLKGISLYFATLYNENTLVFAVWAVVLTCAMGVCLGLLMDVIMKRTGIDLTSREIVEH